MFYLEHFGLTDAGRVRENNEDALLVGEGSDETLFVIADGVGGFEAGEVASGMTVDALRDMDPADSFDDFVREANRRIRTAARGDESLAGMGTTVVAIRFGGTRQRPVAEVAHVGDSRAYLLRGGNLRPLTEDHSLVAELVRSGDLTRDEAAQHPQRNLITRALGPDDNVEVDTAVIPVEADDRVLLCSDGLSDMVREDRILEVLAGSPEDPEVPSKQLLKDALEAGGSDNITLIVIDVKERGERAAEDRSDGTRELPAIGVTPGPTKADNPTKERSGRGKGSRRRKKGRGGGILGKLVRGAAALVVIVLLMTPVYLWASSRFFLDATNAGEVFVYRGVPYTVAGYTLNQEWRDTGINLRDVNDASLPPIRGNTLYTQDDIEGVLAQLRRDAEQNASERRSQQATDGQRQSQGAPQNGQNGGN